MNGLHFQTLYIRRMLISKSRNSKSDLLSFEVCFCFFRPLNYLAGRWWGGGGMVDMFLLLHQLKTKVSIHTMRFLFNNLFLLSTCSFC